MKMKLLLQAFIKGLMGFLMIGLLLFLPAATFSYWNAWLFCGLLFIPMIILGGGLLVNAPDLLEKRLNSKEKEAEQKHVILFSFFLFVAGFVVAALDFRFGWSKLPLWVIIAASAILSNFIGKTNQERRSSFGTGTGRIYRV